MNRSRSTLDRLSEGFGSIAGWSFDHRWWTMAMVLGMVVVGAWLASQVRIDMSMEAFFALEDPSYQTYQAYREDFGSDEVAYLLYRAPEAEHGVWDAGALATIAGLTAALEDEVPFVYEVTSLANAEITRGVSDGIQISSIGDDLPMSQDDILEWRNRVLENPLYVGSLVSSDSRYGAVLIEMDRATSDPVAEIMADPAGGDGLDNLYPQVSFRKIEEILERPEYAGFEFRPTGDVPLNATYNNTFQRESRRLNALAALAAGLVLAFFFRSAVGVLAPLVVVLLSILLVVAFVRVMGWNLDMMFSMVPTLMTAIGVANAVHILSEFGEQFRAGVTRRDALVATFERVGPPSLLTSLTTGIGFLSLSFAPVKSAAHMGIYSSVGVLLCFGFSLTLLAGLLSFGKPLSNRRGSSPPTHDRLAGFLSSVAEFGIRYRRSVLASFGVVFAISLVGIARIEVNSNWLNDFREDAQIRVDTLLLDDVMAGSMSIVYLFDTEVPDGIKDPAMLRSIEAFAAYAKSREKVRHTTAITDVLKDLNRSFHADDPDEYRLPASRDLVAQYLLLYELSGGTEAQELVSSDSSTASVEIRTAMSPSRETGELIEDLDRWLEANPPTAGVTESTGTGELWYRLYSYITTSEIRGFSAAFVAIAITMCALFWSVRAGLLAMVPNLSPVLVVVGAMGWVGIYLDLNTMLIAPVAIGIAVDDTIHLMTRYRREFLRRGNYDEALRASMQYVGRALFITSIVLVFSFLTLLASEMQIRAYFGTLLASVIVVALLADFLLLPALAAIVQPFGPESPRGALVASEKCDAA